MGFGYWVWVIPLGNGETSIGVVFDKRMHSLHEVRAKDREAEYLAFLKAIPALAEILEGATPRREDLHSYAHLAYVTRQYMGSGWALLGDAAAFLDPYYSPGLDHVGFSVEATVEILKADVAREDLTERIAEHNRTFLRSYHRFFRGIFQDKYFYMGEHDLLSATTLLDTAQYYIFVVIPAYKFYGRFHWMPVLGPKPAFFSYHMLRLSNRRMKAIALARRRAGEEGLRNDGRRVKVLFDLKLAPFRMAAKGLKLWLYAELDNVRLALKNSLGRRPPVPDRAPMPPMPTPETMPEMPGTAEMAEMVEKR